MSTIKTVKPDTGTNNREAVGWYDHDIVYLPTNRAAEAAGGVLKEQAHRRRPRSGQAPVFAAAVQPGSQSDTYPGSAMSIAMRCGVASFGRSDKETDPDQLHAVTGHD